MTDAPADRRRRFAAGHLPPIELTAGMADAILGALVRRGLASTSDVYLESLWHALTSRGGASQGLRLGAFSGVKFRTEHTGRGWRVDCYPEERTPELDRRIADANERLADLERELAGDPVEMLEKALTGGDAWGE